MSAPIRSMDERPTQTGRMEQKDSDAILADIDLKLTQVELHEQRESPVADDGLSVADVGDMTTEQRLEYDLKEAIKA